MSHTAFTPSPEQVYTVFGPLYSSLLKLKLLILCDAMERSPVILYRVVGKVGIYRPAPRFFLRARWQTGQECGGLISGYPIKNNTDKTNSQGY